MMLQDAIAIHGRYRVQSSTKTVPSSLKGQRLRDSGILSLEDLNEALTAHCLWQGSYRVEMAPYEIEERSGAFAEEPDVLYKSDLFIPAKDSEKLHQNVIDVPKQIVQWHRRLPYLKRVFSRSSLQRLVGLKPVLKAAVANEYLLHEAGHGIGYPIDLKMQEGFFKMSGKACWPLAYLEEVRADIHGMVLGSKLLSTSSLREVFLYHIGQRFGVQLEGLATRGRKPYGLIPYILFAILYEAQLIRVVHENGHYSFEIQDQDPQGLLDKLRAAESFIFPLSKAELTQASLVDKQKASLVFLTRLLSENHTQSEFHKVMTII